MNISVIGTENLPAASFLRFGKSEKRKIFFKLNIRMGYSENFKIGSRDILWPLADNIDRGGGGGALLLQTPKFIHGGSDGGRKDIARGGET